MDPRHPLTDSRYSSVGLALPTAQIKVPLPLGHVLFAPASACRSIDRFIAAHPEIRRWLLVRFSATATLVGPFFDVAAPPCWHCFRHWLNLRRPHSPGPFRPLTLPSRPAGFRGRVLSIDDASGTSTRHRFPRLPHCPQCGDPASQRTAGFPKFFPATTTHHKNFHSFVDPLLGIVTGLKVFPSPGGFAAAAAKLASPPGMALGYAYGSGDSPALARRAAVNEAVERYSIVAQGDEPIATAALDQVAPIAILPQSLHPFSDRQYVEREAINAIPRSFPWVPPRYDGRTAPWAIAWSMTANQPRLLPFSFAYWTRQFPWCRADSIGCAAGASLAAALDSAVLELIERDAIAIWWANKITPPTVAPHLYWNDPLLRRPLDALAGIRRTVHVFDLTTDLRIPVAGAISWNRRGRLPDFGFGAHPSSAIAIRRAVRELTQTSLGNHAIRRRSTPSDAFQHWRNTVQAGQESHLAPGPEVSPEDAPGSALEALVHAGFDVTALNLTRPETRIPVVRAAVPGLCHPWLRLGAARLSHVPLRLGWLARARREEEWNPLPFAL